MEPNHAMPGAAPDDIEREYLFGTTRAYALDKLEADGEAPEMRRRLARLECALDGQAEVCRGASAPLLTRAGGTPGNIAGRAPRAALHTNDGISVPGTTP
ncbi:hypothetical protein SOM61_11685 [Massilia sp. CFBP9012]|uniref:hypothetical protein n=1 Tax=Massilia sp. CFBP9012 TaxID=3096531 RepID=UPI002A6AFDE1|nr:hypothetical protein [Massilia sp. CFBP9012]MDY0975633.1 hypothetical protein [Massilia sp. CFBP9012]